MKDQHGNAMTEGVGNDYEKTKLTFKYEVYDVNNTEMTWVGPLQQGTKLTHLLKVDPTAKITLQEVMYDGGPNLLKTPLTAVIKAEDKRKVELKIGGATVFADGYYKADINAVNTVDKDVDASTLEVTKDGATHAFTLCRLSR